MSRSIWILSVLVSALWGTVSAQPLGRYSTAPDVWRPERVSAPGVDAKGDLNLDLPVLTVPGRGGLDFPIRFQYASSIRWTEQASWIGLGWRFDPGSIVRDVHGGANVEGASYNVDWTAAPAYLPDVYHVTLPGATASMSRAIGGHTALPPRSAAVSTQPFVLSDWKPWTVDARSTGPVAIGTAPNGDPLHTRDQSGLRDDYARFVITADDGTRYVFDAKTLSTHLGITPTHSGYNHEHFVHTWRLVAILGPDYTGPEIPSGTEAGSWILLTYSDVRTGYSDSTFPSVQLAQETYLSEIRTPTHKATFGIQYNRSNENFPGWHGSNLHARLSSITLRSLAPDAVVTRVDLVPSQTFSGPDNTQRLGLGAIEFQGGGTLPSPGYVFTYNNHVVVAGSQGYADLFGYRNSTFVGTVGAGTNTVVDDGATYSLATIRYPTGGLDRITYSNDQIEHESVPYDVAQYVPGDPTEQFYVATVNITGSNDRQGGARVTSIHRYDGINAIHEGDGVPEATTYTYPAGRFSGIPTRALDLEANVGGAYVGSADRGRAAVHYPWIERQNPDGSVVRTTYSTLGTSIPGQSAPVSRSETVLWRTPEQEDPNLREAYAPITGNQDWNWGLPLVTEHRRSGNSNWTLQTERVHELRAHALATVWARGGRQVRALWYYPGRLLSETVRDRGSSPSASSPSATRRTEYRHFPDWTAAAAPAAPAGNGGVRETDVFHQDGRRRRTRYTYGFEVYPALGTANRLAPVVMEQTAEVSASGVETWHAVSATTWRNPSDQWEVGRGVPSFAPYQTFDWDAPGPSTARPDFPAWTGGSPSGWTATTTFGAYDTNGFATRILDARGHATQRTYNPLGRLVRVVAPTAGGVTLSRRYTYEPRRGLLSRVVDENGNVTRFAYDALGRLLYTYAPGSTSADTMTVASANEYDFGSVPYRIRAAGRVGDTATDEQVTWSHFDGLGRPVQTARHTTPSRMLVSRTQYLRSYDGPVERIWNTLSLPTSSNFVVGPGEVSGTPTLQSHASAWSDASCDDDPDIPPPSNPTERTAGAVGSGSAGSRAAFKPYTDMIEVPDGSGRHGQVNRPVSPTCGTPTVRTTHGVHTINGANYTYTATTDEMGRVTFAFTDAWGHTFRTDVGSPLLARTETDHDVMGRPVRVRPPNAHVPGAPSSWTTVSEYDTRGRLRQHTTPDAGTVRFRYDRAGNLRFRQDAVQDSLGTVSFTSYDALSRPTHGGTAPASFGSLNPDVTQAWETNPANWTVAHAYDQKPTGGPWAPFAAVLTSADASNPLGRLVATASRSDGIWQAELTGYDPADRPARRYVWTASSNGAVDPAFSTWLRYTYDRQGQLRSRAATVGSQSFYQWYTYDLAGRPLQVFASTTAQQPSSPDVLYDYTNSFVSLHYTRTTYGSATPVTSFTDLHGRLADTGGGSWHGNASSSSAPFLAHYDYRLDGSVRNARFGYHTGTGARTYDRFAYTYDGLGRLTAADHSWSQTGNWWYNPAWYDLAAMTYDANGNLTALSRNNATGAAMDRLTYGYAAGTNRLASLSDAAPSSAAVGDAETGTFAYDRNGNPRRLPAPYAVMQASYDERNLPTLLVTGDGHRAHYGYAASGQRYLRRLGDYGGASPGVASGPVAGRGPGSTFPVSPEAPARRSAVGGFGTAAPGHALPSRVERAEAPSAVASPPAEMAASSPSRSVSPWNRPAGRTGEAPSRETQVVATPGQTSAAVAPVATDRGTAAPSRGESRSPFATSATRSAPSADTSQVSTRAVASAPGVATLGEAQPGTERPMVAAVRPGPGEATSARAVRPRDGERDGPTLGQSDGPADGPADGDADGGESAASFIEGRMEYTALDAHAAGGLQAAVATVTRGTTSAVAVEWHLLDASGAAVGRHTAAGQRQYYHRDALGTTRVVTNAAGAVVSSHAYDAWGVALSGRGSGAAPRAGFTGKERLATEGGGSLAGLDDFGARLYAPGIGRFLQVDPKASAMPSWSPYSYAFDNPLRYTDPDGREPVQACPTCWAAGGAFAGDMALQVANFLSSGGDIRDASFGWGAGHDIQLASATRAGGAALLGMGIATSMSKLSQAAGLLGSNPVARQLVTDYVSDFAGTAVADWFSNAMVGQADLSESALRGAAGSTASGLVAELSPDARRARDNERVARDRMESAAGARSRGTQAQGRAGHRAAQGRLASARSRSRAGAVAAAASGALGAGVDYVISIFGQD